MRPSSLLAQLARSFAEMETGLSSPLELKSSLATSSWWTRSPSGSGSTCVRSVSSSSSSSTGTEGSGDISRFFGAGLGATFGAGAIEGLGATGGACRAGAGASRSSGMSMPLLLIGPSPRSNPPPNSCLANSGSTRWRPRRDSSAASESLTSPKSPVLNSRIPRPSSPPGTSELGAPGTGAGASDLGAGAAAKSAESSATSCARCQPFMPSFQRYVRGVAVPCATLRPSSARLSGPVCLPASIANQTGGSRGRAGAGGSAGGGGAMTGALGAGGGAVWREGRSLITAASAAARALATGCRPRPGVASSTLLARSAFSSTPESIACVLSMSLSRPSSSPAGAGARAGGGAEPAVTAAAPAGAGPRAGSAIWMRAPHFLQRTTRRLPRTFSSAMRSVALQLSQLNCMS